MLYAEKLNEKIIIRGLSSFFYKLFHCLPVLERYSLRLCFVKHMNVKLSLIVEFTTSGGLYFDSFKDEGIFNLLLEGKYG